MSEDSRTFHESWYRIAGQRVSLKPSVRVRRQMFRGIRWYVLYDLFSSQFFRLQPASYEFVARLSKNRTVEDVWKGIMESDPDNAPGQEEVIHLLAQLYHANLLQYELSADSVKLFERFRQRKQQIMRSNLLNIMFLRIPLLDPDAFLKRCMPFARFIMGPIGAAIWLVTVGIGVKVCVENFGEIQLQSQGVLAPSNLFLLYAGLVIIKAMHEFGHAFAVRRFGGEVHVMGVMFLIFSPLPYVDASGAWAFRSKWKRAFVGAAGMVMELFIASCAAMVWANTGEGTLHSLTYNMLFVASVSTLVFNLNPLLRYDGYYILSDLLDMPNLSTQSTQQLVYLAEKYAFGVKKAKSPAVTRRETGIYTSFAILSGIYRTIVFSAILLFVADRFLLAGIIMAVICAVAWAVVPLAGLVKYLAASPRLERSRTRAVAVCASTFAVLFGFLYFFPFPLNFKAPGVVRAHEYVVVVNRVNGYIEEIAAPSGSHVKRGDVLLKLTNPELDFDQSETAAREREVTALYQKALDKQQADMQPLASALEAVRKHRRQLARDREDLLVKAEIEGTWIAPRKDYIGMWIIRGTPLGQLVNDKTFYFSCVVSQQEASRIFSNEIKKSQVRLTGQSDVTIRGLSYTRIPMEQTTLPSPALGWGGGGDVAINTKDSSGRKAAEPFYELRAEIAGDTPALLLHGRSGRIRFQAGSEPLLQQWWRKLRQLVQKRYQI
ncbi:MAG: hypothetical protein ACM3OC_09270 [Deltaproteobacteria bacterium]